MRKEYDQHQKNKIQKKIQQKYIYKKSSETELRFVKAIFRVCFEQSDVICLMDLSAILQDFKHFTLKLKTLLIIVLLLFSLSHSSPLVINNHFV
jgi:hypothetical protein